MPLSSPYRQITLPDRSWAETMLAQMQEYRREVGRKLKQLRTDRQWSAETAAHEVGIAVRTWGDWERGKRWPYNANWKKIIRTFGVDPRGTPPLPLGLGGPPDDVQLDRMEAKLDLLLKHSPVPDTEIEGVATDFEALAGKPAAPAQDVAGSEGAAGEKKAPVRSRPPAKPRT